MNNNVSFFSCINKNNNLNVDDKKINILWTVAESYFNFDVQSYTIHKSFEMDGKTIIPITEDALKKFAFTSILKIFLYIVATPLTLIMIVIKLLYRYNKNLSLQKMPVTKDLSDILSSVEKIDKIPYDQYDQCIYANIINTKKIITIFLQNSYVYLGIRQQPIMDAITKLNAIINKISYPIGIPNFGNTCFLSAALQLILTNKDLVEKIKNENALLEKSKEYLIKNIDNNNENLKKNINDSETLEDIMKMCSEMQYMSDKFKFSFENVCKQKSIIDPLREFVLKCTASNCNNTLIGKLTKAVKEALFKAKVISNWTRLLATCN